MERCAAGMRRSAGLDAEALGLAHERLSPSLSRLAYLIVRDRTLAADLVQETWATAWRERANLRDSKSLQRWLTRILVNKSRMALRSARRHPVEPLIGLDGPSAEGDPEVVALERDVVARLFGTLEVDDRALLVLHYLEDRPVAEIGATLGIPEGTVKSRLHRIRQRLLSELRLLE